jgi:hypothetical protein
MILEQLQPPPITQASCVLGRSDDIGEEDCSQDPVRLRDVVRPGQERLDRVKDRVRIDGPQGVVITR